MPRHRPRRRRVCSPGLEALEGRRLLAQFNVPWTHADHLTVSFVPDGTSVAGTPSGLFRTLDSQQPTADWQSEILSAFQTWAAVAGVNFALVPDGGQPLGTPGPDQGDPRFGDIRIAAQPMSPEVLSISVPHDPFLSGTWSGDILLNDSTPTIGRADTLFPVLLHEVGHVLGLGDSTDPASVMYPQLGDRTTLAPSDIAAVQALYGPRDDDPIEGPSHNDTTWTAAPMPEPAGYDGTTPLLFYAGLTSNSASDFYTLKVPAGYDGPLTLRLQTAGVSLLEPRLTVLDPAGHVVGDLASTALGGDTLQVQLPYVRSGETYAVEVRGATGGIFGVGEYVVAANFDARSTVGPAAIDTLARQSYSYLSSQDIQAIFLDPVGALFHVDAHTNDTFATAEYLAPAGAYGSQAPDRITASLSDPTDVDVYHIETPDSDTGGPPLVMTVTVRATQVNGIMPTVAVFDGHQDPVPSLVLAHGDGTFTIQVTDVQPDSDYFVRVSADPTSGKVVGNYDLDVEYGHTDAAPATFLDGSLDGPGRRQSFDLVVKETQLFDLLLAATAPAAPPGVDLRMVLTDNQGRVVAERIATPGETAGGDPVLLPPGVYRATFIIDAPGGAATTAMSFRLYGASLTDPIGPALEDTTLRPMTSAIASDGLAASLPVLGSDGAPYYWLALSLGGRGAPGPGDVQAPGSTGIGPVSAQASAFATAGVATTDGPSATADNITTIVAASSFGQGLATATPVPTRLALATASIGAPFILSIGLVPAGLTESQGERPVNAQGAARDVSSIIPEAVPVKIRPLPAPPSSASPDTRPQLEASQDRRLARSDPRDVHDEAGVGPDIVQTIAILGMAATVYGRLHSDRTARRTGLPVHPFRPCPPFMRSRAVHSLNLCSG